ncbi:MAG: DUF2779 domain-containing protein [Nanoarchaeota archaeon]|nr:DUF2779 domain-containing protein [Nanoarchaeota archaeon]
MEQQTIKALKLKSLSKSSYTTGLECPGHLWMKYHDKENIPPHPPGVLRRFEQGNIVGELAKKLFPEGIDIATEDYTKNLQKTKELLLKRKILFEAALQVDNLYGRADILIPVGKDQWDVIEVKSSTKVDKKKHYPDLAFQRYVYEKAGLKIRKCFLMHLNNEYVRNGEVELQKLFVQEDLTEEIDMKEVPKNIEFLWNIVQSPTFPNTAEKNYCTQPKECLIKDRCWDFLPEHHVFHLYNGRKNRALFDEGIHDLKDVSEGRLSNAQQAIQLNCAKTGKVHVDKKQIKGFLDSLDKTECHLDFETCMFAIPEFQGTRPYQRMPFQFSLHVIKNGKQEHFEYLHDGKDDPRPAFLAALKEKLPAKGSVVVYSQGFESSVLKELARDFPSYKEWVDSVLARVVDLRVPFSKFWYYNPVQHGSASIKKVLPALVGDGYEDLNIKDGDCASIAYLDMTFGKMTAEAKKKTREDLLKYCERDTEAMVWIVEKMKRIINKS